MEFGPAITVIDRPTRAPHAPGGDLAALARVRARVAPLTLAEQHVLPVLPALAGLFPTGLRRGSALAVTGDAAVSMALALAAGPTAAGAWAVVLGLNGSSVGPGGAGPELGLGAAAGMGVAMDRLVLAEPGPSWPAVLAMVVDGFDVVIVRPPRSLTASVWRRIAARLRERGGVVLAVDPPASFEVAAIVTATGTWSGVQDGAGVLRSRVVVASVGGRGALARVRRATLLLPGPDGAVATGVPAGLVDAGPVDAGPAAGLVDGAVEAGLALLRSTG